jgi:hypothetical protein
MIGDEDDFPPIETDDLSPPLDTEGAPPPNTWQEIEQSRLEKDLLSGVAWQPSVTASPAPIKPTAGDKRREISMEVASWHCKTRSNTGPQKRLH